MQIAAEVLGRLKPEEIPSSLRAIAKFTPAGRRQRGAAAIVAALDADDTFRARVGDVVAETMPDLVETLHAGATPIASDPSDVAAVAYLVRPDGWAAIVADATARWSAQRSRPDASQQERLQAELAQARTRLRSEMAKGREAVAAAIADLEAANADLRRQLRTRAAETHAALRERDEARTELTAERARVEAADSAREAELRRLRARIAELERASGSARREARADRDVDDARLWLLVETLVDAASGVRRELSLPAPSMRPADAVAATAAAAGAGRTADDPAALDRLLALPRVHVIVDGYNVTLGGYRELPLSDQRDRLVQGMSTLAGRSGAEITIAFDGRTKPTVQPRTPRGIRVLFSAADEIADDLIRRLVDAEPAGRPVVVVTSDQQVVADVRRAGAWTVPSAVLLARLG